MLEVTRKKPIQARAVHTVEILLDAAAQVLEHEGEAHFTTNRVAETAGFSIGTLYQYFPNKHSIITALVSREQDRARSILHRAIARAAPQDVESIVRIVVRTCLNALGGRRRARRALIFQMIRLNQGLEFLRGMDELTRGIVEAMTARGLAGVAARRPCAEVAPQRRERVDAHVDHPAFINPL